MTTTTAVTIIVACTLVHLGLVTWGPRRAKRPGENRIEPAPHKVWVTACSMIVFTVGIITCFWQVLAVLPKQS